MGTARWEYDGCHLLRQRPRRPRREELWESTSPALPGAATCHPPPRRTPPAPHPTRAAPHPSLAERVSFDPETLREGTSHLDRTRCVLSRPSVRPEARTQDDDCSVTTRAGAGAGAGVLLSRSRRGPRRHPAALQGRPRPCARRNRCSSLGRFGPDGLRNTGG